MNKFVVIDKIQILREIAPNFIFEYFVQYALRLEPCNKKNQSAAHYLFILTNCWKTNEHLSVLCPHSLTSYDRIVYELAYDDRAETYNNNNTDGIKIYFWFKSLSIWRHASQQTPHWWGTHYAVRIRDDANRMEVPAALNEFYISREAMPSTVSRSRELAHVCDVI